MRRCFQELDQFGNNVKFHFGKAIDFWAESENGEALPLCEFFRNVEN